ncbi:MAG: peptidoglycan DD-metalloendopeptidase family protein [Aeromicrobium sp.]
MFSHTRIALTAALLSAALVAGLTAPSFADKKHDLEQQKNEANSRARDAQKDLEGSTKKFAEATAALKAAEAKLGAAQTTLDQTRGKVVVAEAFDAEMQSKLEQSQADLKAARAELAKGEKQLSASEKSVEEFAVQDYLEGDRSLRAVSGLLQGDDPAAYGEQVSLNGAVSDDQVATMQRLDATRVILKLKRQKVQKLRDQVKVQRADAAANLAEKKQLQAAAEQQAAQVADLVTAREGAASAAATARAEDERLLAEFQAESNRLEAELQKVVEEELRKARERAEREAQRKAGQGGQADDPEPPATGDSDGTLSRPVSGPITSPYGMRVHPITGVYKLHDGMDFGVPCGTPVKAAAAGTILQQYFNGAYGNRIILNNGVKRGVSVVTTYNHLSRFALKAGAKVQRGQVIGYSGTTGYSTGCHLHFMVLTNGSTVNPAGWL